MALREFTKKEPTNGSDGRFVTEQAVKLPPEILKCDRFYWRCRLTDVAEDWRRAEVGRELQPLFDDLFSVERLLSFGDQSRSQGSCRLPKAHTLVH